MQTGPQPEGTLPRVTTERTTSKGGARGAMAPSCVAGSNGGGASAARRAARASRRAASASAAAAHTGRAAPRLPPWAAPFCAAGALGASSAVVGALADRRPAEAGGAAPTKVRGIVLPCPAERCQVRGAALPEFRLEHT
ncbi:unnamed protein product [Prorocentrum cordatum]|uniref:Uncharacterized protein n=1 Tax=Prorocentrum cordatum TaxID=2364126 RepID=A0ABN9SUU5_9DINO|nr:unnamed protein product [Polarella glacialis]